MLPEQKKYCGSRGLRAQSWRIDYQNSYSLRRKRQIDHLFAHSRTRKWYRSGRKANGARFYSQNDWTSKIASQTISGRQRLYQQSISTLSAQTRYPLHHSAPEKRTSQRHLWQADLSKAQYRWTAHWSSKTIPQNCYSLWETRCQFRRIDHHRFCIPVFWFCIHSLAGFCPDQGNRLFEINPLALFHTINSQENNR